MLKIEFKKRQTKFNFVLLHNTQLCRNEINRMSTGKSVEILIEIKLKHYEYSAVFGLVLQ